MNENQRPPQQMEVVPPTNPGPDTVDLVKGALWLMGIQTPSRKRQPRDGFGVSCR